MRRVLILAVLFAMAMTARAQVREEVTVEVVDVPVYVYNNGQPVRNLTKDDFELFVNGKRQQIDYFDTIDFASAPAKAAVASAPQPAPPPVRDLRERRLFLLIVDLAYNRPAAVDRARRAAVQMVDHALPDDFFALVVYKSTGAQFVIPFTRDRDVIHRALAELSSGRTRDALGLTITSGERANAEAWAHPDDEAKDIGSDRFGESPMTEFTNLMTAGLTQRAKNLAKAQMEDIGAIAGRLAELDGYKHAIFFSEAFDEGLFYDGPSPDPVMENALTAMAEAFHRAGVLFHTIDLRVIGVGHADPRVMTAPSLAQKIAGKPSPGAFEDATNGTLFRFANRTGGEFIHWTNDITGALGRLSTTVAVGYRLGFRPVNARKGDNRIVVKVKNAPAGSSLSFRTGFSTTPPAVDSKDALLLADVIQNDTPQSGTPPSFLFRERPFIDIVVPARQLARQFGAVPDAELILYVFDAKGSAVDYREKKIAIPADPAGEIIVRDKLELPSGTYVAKSLLRVGGSLGFARTSFVIP